VNVGVRDRMYILWWSQVEPGTKTGTWTLEKTSHIPAKFGRRLASQIQIDYIHPDKKIGYWNDYVGVRDWMPATVVSPFPRRDNSFSSKEFVSSLSSIVKFGEGVERMWEKSWTRKGF